MTDRDNVLFRWRPTAIARIGQLQGRVGKLGFIRQAEHRRPSARQEGLDIEAVEIPELRQNLGLCYLVNNLKIQSSLTEQQFFCLKWGWSAVPSWTQAGSSPRLILDASRA